MNFKKAVIFDFDLTLADATQGIYQCMNHALRQSGFAVQDFETIKKTIGHTIPESFKLLTGNSDIEIASKFTSIFVEHADKIMNINTFVYNSVFDILPAIKKNGHQISIVSTKYRYRISNILERENLSQYIDYVIGGEDVKFHKPNPEGLLLALEKMRVQKNQAIYIGDSIIDARAAQNAEIDFCAVLTGTSSRNEFQQLAFRFIIDDLIGLKPILNLDV